jgi:hypothetical protein
MVSERPERTVSTFWQAIARGQRELPRAKRLPGAWHADFLAALRKTRKINRAARQSAVPLNTVNSARRHNAAFAALVREILEKS